MKLANLLFSILIIFSSYKTNAQGCSDSGFCTMGALKPDQFFFGKRFYLRLNSIELTHHIGLTKFNDVINSAFLDFNVSITKKTNIQVRLPAYTIIEGKMPTTRGWGDLYINVSQNVYATDRFQLSLTAGTKIYTSQADKKSDDGHPMPMYQQTSYGSNDINFGASVLTKKWHYAAGYQHALNQTQNQFSSDQWTNSPLYNTVKAFDQSKGLQRGDDIMFRAERSIKLSRFNLYVGALNLWRVTPDKTVNENGIFSNVTGSTGMAVNLIVGAGYQFNTQMGIRLLTSTKLKERDANPDGLSRDFIGQVAYVIRF